MVTVGKRLTVPVVAHMVMSDIVTVGAAFTVTVTSAVLEQPLSPPMVPVTWYVFVSVGLTSFVLPSPRSLSQLKVVAVSLVAVSVAVSPGQMFVGEALAVMVGRA